MKRGAAGENFMIFTLKMLKRFSIFLKTNFWFSKTPGGASSPLSPPPGYAPGFEDIFPDN